MNSTFLWTDSNAYASSYWSTEQVIETWARRKECATPGPRGFHVQMLLWKFIDLHTFRVSYEGFVN